MSNRDAIRAQREALRDEAAQALARYEEMLAHDIDQCAETARAMAVLETQLAGDDASTLAEIVRRRVTAWVAWRNDVASFTLNTTVAGDLAALEPQLVALVPTFVEAIRKHPGIGRALESLLDELLTWRRMDAIAWTAPVPNAEALLAAFEKCAAFLQLTAIGFVPFITNLLKRVDERRRTVPLAWGDGIHASESEGRHVRWLLHVAGLHGHRPIDFDRPQVLAALLEPERVARELEVAALGCGLVADALQHGIVPVPMLDAVRGGAADALTKFMHTHTRRWLYETVGVLMRATLPRMTKAWRPGAQLEPYVRAAAKAHRKRAAAYERAGRPPIRKAQANERWFFTPHER